MLAGDFLVKYPEGGGHWTVFLQYLLGLRALGHDVWWLERFPSTGSPDRDARLLAAFFRRMDAHGFADRAVVLVAAPGVHDPALEDTERHGAAAGSIEEVARSADVAWNFTGALRARLLGLFRRRVLVDLDPGHLHVAAQSFDFAIDEHHAFLTVGLNVGAADCGVPRLGVEWRPFLPIVHTPLWRPCGDPGPDAPFTSVTHWTWETLPWGDRMLSVSKRDAYLRYVTLPEKIGRPVELAVHLDRDDRTGDRELLQRHGWRLVHAHDVAGSPAAYREYIARSRAELACPKPIHRELRTGWFSDRSVCYLASGRPVLMEDTGFGDRLPTGEGLVVFHDLDEAAAGVAAIDADHARHARAARALAEDLFASERQLPAMIDASAP